MNRSSLRNIIIFSIVAIAAGWLGVWINTQIPSPSPQESLGILIWIFAPMLTGLLLRGLGKDGWKDFGLSLNLKGNAGWYIFSFLLYPVTIFVTLLLGGIFKAVTFEGLASKGFTTLLHVIAFGIAASLVKNIAEEFAWRGYLTPRLQAAGFSNLKNHLLTGVVWSVWHIPYWIFFLGAENIRAYTNMGMTAFVIIGLLAIFPIAIVFGELRLKTGTLWPAYVAHNMTNAITAQLVIEGFIKFKSNAQILFAPGTDGLIMFVIFSGIGYWMLKNNVSHNMENK